jgi:hypothetical protein
MKFGKRGKSNGAAGGSGTRCTDCKGGWVEFKTTKQVPVKGIADSPAVTGYEVKTTVQNVKCGQCDGTGWK